MAVGVVSTIDRVRPRSPARQPAHSVHVGSGAKWKSSAVSVKRLP